MVEQQAEAMRWLSRRCHDLQLEVLRLTVVRERHVFPPAPLCVQERSVNSSFLTAIGDAAQAASWTTNIATCQLACNTA